MPEIKLITGSLEMSFCDQTGVLYGMKAIDTGWDIIGENKAGLSWRILLPLSEELRNNDILGEKQKLTSVKADAGKIVFKWDNVVSERGGAHDIGITLTVSAEGRQAVYEIEIDNRSEYVAESVHCPYIVNIDAPKGAKWLRSFGEGYATGQEASVWPYFNNMVGYFGADYPTQINQGTPSSPFFLLRSENQGLYWGVKSKAVAVMAWHGELRPGWDSSIDARVPDSIEIAGKPVEKRFGAVHMAYVMPGEKRTLSRVALEAFEGGWQAGANIYTAWRKTWMKPAVAPDWAREPHSWQQLHINSPEDELRLKFVDLPKVAEVCKQYGVKAIQLVGWNDGGQDQGNPSHDPDPRLGTYEELKEAIKKCHDMGVKVILFSKFTWADRGTQAFKDEHIEYAVKDPYGDYYHYGGYQYQTLAQFLDINTKRLVPMCFGSEKYMQVCEREFMKLVDLGAAGMLFDECQHHSPARMCFDESHGHKTPWPVYTNDRAFIDRLRNLEGTPSDFLMAGEACYDWEMEAYELMYYRTESKTHIPLNRYLWPHQQYMTAVTGFNDRNMLNQCLMHRFVISYEPYNFKGCLTEYPDTMAYGQKVDALRTEYRKWFWDGEYCNATHAKAADLSGKPYDTFSIFKADDNSLGAVVCNYEDAEQTVELTKEDGTHFEKYRLVDDTEWKTVRGGVVIPARSAAIVL